MTTSGNQSWQQCLKSRYPTGPVPAWPRQMALAAAQAAAAIRAPTANTVAVQTSSINHVTLLPILHERTFLSR